MENKEIILTHTSDDFTKNYKIITSSDKKNY